jgi:outer membrane lipoprotein-sorting protein
MRSSVLPLVLTLVLTGGSAAAELQTAEEIDACYRDNFPKESSVQVVSMKAVDRIGATTESRSKMYWKKFDDGFARVMMRFEKPADLRGAGLLMVEKKDRNDMFIYLPVLRRVKRITSRMTSGSMFGTDFSYEDRPAYVLEVRPTEKEESAYERIKAFIDKETCVTLRAEFYERGDKPRKVLTNDPSKLTRVGEIWVPHEFLMRDHRDETHTRMSVEEVEVGVEIPRKIFSQKELESGAR